jgi:hypothetical protein
MRQHRNDAVGEIDAGSAKIGFFLEGCFFNNIMAYICNVNS